MMKYCYEIQKYTHCRGYNLKKGNTNGHLSDLCQTFSLSNLVNGVTCVKLQNGTSLHVMLTNRPRRFHNTNLIEIDLSDCHRIIISAFRAFFKRLRTKVIEYRHYKTFDHNEFLQNLYQELIKSNLYNDEQQYDIFTSIFQKILDNHDPLKLKKHKGNQGT